MLENSVPQYDVVFSDQNVKNPVYIHYDEFASPHIEAESLEDICYAQGFAHARERMWQMDFSRRICEGSLSRVMGEATLSIDKFSRNIGFYRTAENVWKYVEKDRTSRLILESYAKGVNAYLRLVRDGKVPMPIEFTALQYEPEDWKPQHSIGMVKLMAWVLNLSWHIDITMSEINMKLGYEKAKLFFPDYPLGKPIVVDSVFWNMQATAVKGKDRSKQIKKQNLGVGEYLNKSALEFEIEILKAFMNADRMCRKINGWGEASHFGSNAWAVSGKKTVSGKAILANDPHLQFSVPTQWMDMQLMCSKENINVAGESLPGAPLIVLGKNDNIAWGITNIMLDDCDFFKWRNLQDFTQVSGYKQIQESIHIKGKNEPFTMLVHTIPNGVLISEEIYRGTKNEKSSVLQNATIGMMWTGYEKSNEVSTFYQLAKAGSWSDFRQALQTIGAPGLNFVYADKEGNIGYQAAALVPKRMNTQVKPTVLIRDASDNMEAWNGSVPFDELPSIYNPASGILVSANNRIAPTHYPYYLTSHWEPASRAERIVEMLQDSANFNASYFKKIQSDVTSPHVRDIMKVALPILESNANLKYKDNLDWLKKWEYGFEEKSVPALIYSVFFDVLLNETFKDELGETIFRNYLFSVNVPTRAIYETLLDSSKFILFDNVLTSEKETREQIISRSFEKAIVLLKTKLGESKKWLWGDVHRLNAQHTFSRAGSPIGKYFDFESISTGGTSVTPNNGEYKYQVVDSSYTILFSHILGASSRRIVDFSTEDGSFLSVIPGGNSGHVRSPHYSDQLKLWSKQEYRLFSVKGTRTEAKIKKWKTTELAP
ncbi:hypothetical protein CHS0354_024150 [Potamilus streckersoni]|uniref:Penicillin acylase family protein n=1 Tax=Potamilus streckersoni TaxID=2493646 RepID=A0AAE0RZQ7_9BIVA|nr:hypothetical protein CHS0354_024150 [Potamilus streckersoni]